MEMSGNRILVINFLIFVFLVSGPYDNARKIDPEKRLIKYVRNHVKLENDSLRIKHNSRNPNQTCKVKVNNQSALRLKQLYGAYQPNFARFHMNFKISEGQSVSSTQSVIQPFQWFWTYYSLEGLFSYLKWPIDFSILSFGLLDAKTLPRLSSWIDLELHGSNCSLVIGTNDSDDAIAEALKELTQDYLLKVDTAISYSYWCYLIERPGVRTTTDYQMSLYLEYPVEFVEYKCCHTQSLVKNSSALSVIWKKAPIEKMLISALYPYIMSIIAFAYFPIFLTKISSSLSSRGKHGNTDDVFDIYSIDDTEDTERDMQNIDNDPIAEESGNFFLGNNINDGEKFVYLSGKSPISVLTLVRGLCGVRKRHPIAVSRFFRILFVVVSPSVLWIRMFIYKHDPVVGPMVQALLAHKCPMGYLSMLGGFEKSRELFLPVFGGPYMLLLGFYILGLLFVILPNNVDKIIESGCTGSALFTFVSPLTFDFKTLEKYSSVTIHGKNAYAKTKNICTAGLFMFFSPRFWCYYARLQYERFCTITSISQMCQSRLLSYILRCVCILPYLFCAVLELCFILLFYGIPAVNFLNIVVKGYYLTLIKLKENGNQYFRSLLAKSALRFILIATLPCLFGYYMFSACTIFSAAFVFLSKLLLFSFVAVIVYSSSSFGYLFFGIVLVYYVFKMFQKFGDGYFELLADAVEVGIQIDEDPYRAHIVDGTVVIEHAGVGEINKLQIHDFVINLSTDQRLALQNACAANRQHPVVVYKNHVAAISKDLFMKLVEKYRPIHIQLAMTLMKLCLIVALITVTMSVIVVKPAGSVGLSEVMHVVFIVAIGALPKILEVAVDNVSHSVMKDIRLREMKMVIIRYNNDTHRQADLRNLA